MSGLNNKQRILYIGNEIGLPKLLEVTGDIEVVACIYQKEKCKDTALIQDDSFYIGISDKNELADKVSVFVGKIDFAIMYSFGIIIPKSVLDMTTIYNFHPGDLRNNRGSSPVNWSILLNEKHSIMTLHLVEEGIDCGEVVSEHRCDIYDHDIPGSLKKRMEGEIPSMMLELMEFRQEGKSGIRIKNGSYRRRIEEEDYTIHESDSREIIWAKIRSQYSYNGAVVIKNGIKYHVKSLYEYDRIVKGT